ncbi:hypothetical protein D1007_10118 [Hordeum vulgare]|nr:hypothetical protein D1007_10118 [Hordeum vulgare]
MCSEPTSLAVLMAKADKYAMADSAMQVKVTASDKAVPTPATPKPAGDSRGGQNNKRKADQLDSRSTSKQVANVEEDTPPTQGGAQWQRTGKNTWLPKLTFEQMLDGPCKMHTGAKTSSCANKDKIKISIPENYMLESCGCSHGGHMKMNTQARLSTLCMGELLEDFIMSFFQLESRRNNNTKLK